jgi:diguanylate cyclase (GGDEF)-like protein
MTGTEKMSSFSIIMFDLDNFKMINDTLGHDVGDDALRQFARFLRHHCDNVDFVARFGGDEFIIVLDSMSPAELKKRVAVIREQFSEYEGNKVGNFKLDLSAGYFIHNKDLKISTGELIRIIDERMFRDKRKRSNGKTN